MAPADAGGEQPHKAHRQHKSGAKARKKKGKGAGGDDAGGEKKNPKAFAFQSAAKAKRLQARSAEIEQRRLHVPIMDRSIGEPPPFVVVVQGPPQVGKSLLIKCLVKHYTKQNLSEVCGPITVVSGKNRRVQFLECPNDINGMIDAAKIADLALLLIDGSYGFEMAAKIEPGDMLKRKGESTEGIARCTFEDRILMSDIVFMRAWVNVEVPTYCNLVTTALQPRDQTWQGMRTTAELRRAHNIPIPHNKDSVYKPIERKVRKFNPVEIPAKLQHLLPFKSKPKDTPKRKKAPIENRVPVLMEPGEKKKYAALQQLMLLKHEKARKKRIKDEMKKKAYEAEKAKTEQLTKKRQREERRVRYREEDKQHKRARR